MAEIQCRRGRATSVQRQAQGEHRAAFGAILPRAHAAVLFRDLLHHRKAEARAARLAGGVGLKPALASFGQAGPLSATASSTGRAAVPIRRVATSTWGLRLSPMACAFLMRLCSSWRRRRRPARTSTSSARSGASAAGAGRSRLISTSPTRACSASSRADSCGGRA